MSDEKRAKAFVPEKFNRRKTDTALDQMAGVHRDGSIANGIPDDWQPTAAPYVDKTGTDD